MANPGSKKLAREASRMHSGKFPKQIELAFSYDIKDGYMASTKAIYPALSNYLHLVSPIYFLHQRRR